MNDYVSRYGIKFWTLAMSQGDTPDPGQRCRQSSTNSRTVTDGREPEMQPSSAAHMRRADTV